MSDTLNLKPQQTISCDDCDYVIPSGCIWFCPECFSNLCDTCKGFHSCNIEI